MILRYMRDHYPEVIWCFYEFASASGLRPSEQIALWWGDIDWNARTAQVCRAIVRHRTKPPRPIPSAVSV